MKNSQDLNSIVPNAVGDDVGQVRDYEFAGSADPAGATSFWVGRQAVNQITKAACDFLGRLLVVSTDIVANVAQVLHGGVEP